MVEPIQIEGLHFSYGKEEVLRGIDLHLKNGEVLGVLGPNGSGKSTLMSVICGIRKNWSGKISVMGDNLRDLSTKKLARIVSYIPQSFEPSFDLKVETIVSFGRNPHLKGLGNMTNEDYRIIEESMRLTEVYEFRDRPFSTLSGGEKQRVIIAKALAQEGKILLMDEFTTHLDPGHARRVGKIATDLVRAKGLSAIAIFHDINQAVEISDRLLFINNGRALASGKVWDIVTPEIISLVYGLKSRIMENPISGLPLVVFYD
ncbi:ABC transporter ATP-binding protein [Mesotoga prima]|jgi:iron complex transport system ATP-binding protein|uniref:ABC transporter ATP-binding protein n=1 Tax=Mesotoga TaxID=1184396 RepID=UPI0002CA5A81|nr:ABC transporter ATP-binding protein [Mesotoga prima]MCP5457233.1 ABC transporter ATP-binding protein [Thermotogota bacterium]CCU84256.1 ABC transporter related protein [Mesotoga infera]MCP5461106.1 ABC transporter ATP-binding protein [Thermotogota bacterium]HNQ70916.1 ABC transporter ATP-binding protein [Mesotoga prima]HNS75668.1 ABC transporter ATP-binding protein [Mesotoga prima]